MGIYDREYYRDESRGPGFFSGAAPVCKALILANAAAFLLLAIFGDIRLLAINPLVASPEAIFRGFEVHRLLTASFLHNDLLALVFGMMFLWMAGREMEIVYRGSEFLGLYLTAAVVSTLCWAVAAMSMGLDRAIWFGSAGPVTAIFVLYALYYPHREVLLFGIVRLEVWMLLMLYFGLMFLQTLKTPGGRASPRSRPMPAAPAMRTSTRRSTCAGRGWPARRGGIGRRSGSTRPSPATRGRRSPRPARPGPRGRRALGR